MTAISGKKYQQEQLLLSLKAKRLKISY